MVAGGVRRGYGGPVVLSAPAAPPPVAPVIYPLRDRVLPPWEPLGGSRARVAAAPGRRYRLPDGSHLRVVVSPSYKATQADVERFADRFFGTLLHGPEMERLTVRVETNPEVQRDCGAADVLACYSPAAETMVVPGSAAPSGQFPQAFIIAHEYGHHIARNRLNTPWDASTFGPKHWATEEHICGGVYARRRTFFPGDEGRHYIANPGEDWAETTAMARFPQYLRLWQFLPRLKPDAAAFAAARTDILRSWRGPARLGYRAVLSPARAVRTIRLTTPLDGRVRISLSPTAGVRAEIRAYGPKGEALGRANTNRAELDVCGARRLTFRIVHRAGAGAVGIRITRP